MKKLCNGGYDLFTETRSSHRPIVPSPVELFLKHRSSHRPIVPSPVELFLRYRSSHRPIVPSSVELFSQTLIVPSSHHIFRSDRPIPLRKKDRPIVPLSIFLETGSSHHRNLFLKRSSHRPIHMDTNRPISGKRSSHRPIHMDTNRPISEKRSSHRPISQNNDRPIYDPQSFFNSVQVLAISQWR